MLESNDIREKLKNKNFDEKTLNYICNFVEEFDYLFGKYVNKEEVMKRIIKNFEGFEFLNDFKKGVLGSYSNFTKKISISKNIVEDEEKIKSVFFHEMIHCITTDLEESVTGFSQKNLDKNNEEFKVTMHGFTEGFTQYATKIRDKKYLLSKEGNAYPILTEQVANIALLIGEDRFFNIAFNNSQNLIEEMELEYGATIELEELFDAFEIIWKEEKKIYREKNIISQEKLLLKSIFGNYIESNELTYAKNTIILTLEKLLLTRSISTIDEFNHLYYTMKVYIEQLDASGNVKMYELLFDKLKELKNGDNLIDEEIIKKIDSEDLKIFVEQENYINSIKRLSNKEKLIKFSKQEVQEEISNYGFYEGLVYAKEQRVKLSNAIIETNSEVAQELLNILPIGLAETVLKNNWNLDKIGLEYINLDEMRVLFNLYEFNIEDKKYLGTFGCQYDSGDLIFEKYTNNISSEKRKNSLKEHPEFANMFLLENQYGNIIGYLGNDEYVDDYGRTGKAEYCKSREEKILEKINFRLKSFKRMKELGAYEIMLDNELIILRKEIEKLKEIEENSIILEEIEQVSVDISTQRVCEIMEKIKTQKLGLQILEIEKDFSRLDNVENKMKEHLNDHEKNLENLNELVEKKFEKIFG